MVDLPEADIALAHRMGCLAQHHLYYRLRQTYSDHLLHEAPGHLFLEHETEDLASFLQVAMFNGWGGYVLAEANYVNAFFSHNEYIDFFAEHDELLADVRKEFGTGPQND